MWPNELDLSSTEFHETLDQGHVPGFFDTVRTRAALGPAPGENFIDRREQNKGARWGNRYAFPQAPGTAVGR